MFTPKSNIDMTLDELVTLVTLRIDEYTENITGQAPEAPIGDIKEELIYAARSILRKMDRRTAMVAAVHVSNVVPVQPGTPQGTVLPLPDDFLRFVSVKMADWNHTVTRFHSDASNMYNQQVYDRRRGTVEKPMAFMIPYNNTSKRALEVFPNDTVLETIVYVPYLAPENMPKDFEDALVWNTAGRVLIIMRYPQLAQAAFAESDKALAELNQGAYGEEG